MSNYLFTNPKNNRRLVFMIQITNISETNSPENARFLPNRKISYCTRIKIVENSNVNYTVNSCKTNKIFLATYRKATFSV